MLAARHFFIFFPRKISVNVHFRKHLKAVKVSETSQLVVVISDNLHLAKWAMQTTETSHFLPKFILFLVCSLAKLHSDSSRLNNFGNRQYSKRVLFEFKLPKKPLLHVFSKLAASVHLALCAKFADPKKFVKCWQFLSEEALRWKLVETPPH